MHVCMYESMYVYMPEIEVPIVGKEKIHRINCEFNRYNAAAWETKNNLSIIHHNVTSITRDALVDLHFRQVFMYIHTYLQKQQGGVIVGVTISNCAFNFSANIYTIYIHFCNTIFIKSSPRKGRQAGKHTYIHIHVYFFTTYIHTYG